MELTAYIVNDPAVQDLLSVPASIALAQKSIGLLTVLCLSCMALSEILQE